MESFSRSSYGDAASVDVQPALEPPTTLELATHVETAADAELVRHSFGLQCSDLSLLPLRCVANVFAAVQISRLIMQWIYLATNLAC